MSTELSTSKRFCKIAAFKPKSSKFLAFIIAGVLLLIATFAAYDIGYNLIYGLGLLLTVLSFTLTLLIDNFFLLLEAASIITGYVAAGACVVASIACFNMAISNDKKNKLESADIEYDQNCLVFYTSKDERYVLTEIKNHLCQR